MKMKYALLINGAAYAGKSILQIRTGIQRQKWFNKLTEQTQAALMQNLDGWFMLYKTPSVTIVDNGYKSGRKLLSLTVKEHVKPKHEKITAEFTVKNPGGKDSVSITAVVRAEKLEDAQGFIAGKETVYSPSNEPTTSFSVVVAALANTPGLVAIYKE